MSIASEISRIQSAKSALKTSINAKTDSQHQITNETIDNYSSFVDSITGGGEHTGAYKVSSVAEMNALTDMENGDYCIVYDNIPSTYTLVEYLKSTGTQYIKTDIVPINTMGIYMKIASQVIGTDCTFVGSKNTQQDVRFYIGNSGSKYYYGFNTITPGGAMPTATIDRQVKLSLNYQNSRENVCNYKVIENINTQLNSNINYPISIFAGNYSGTIDYKAKIELYELFISQNNNTIYKFVPVIRNSDNVKGLYETVNNVFYTNDGTGSFSAGNPIPYSYSVYKYNTNTGWAHIY